MSDQANNEVKGKELFNPVVSAGMTGLAIKKVRYIENLLHANWKSKAIQEHLGINKFEYSHLTRISRKLSEQVKDLLLRSRLSLGHARALTRLSAIAQEKAARDAISKHWSVGRLEQEVRSIIEGKPVNDDNSYYENLGEKISSIIGHPVKIIPSKNDQSTGTIQITYLGYDAFDGIMARMRVNLEEEF